MRSVMVHSDECSAELTADDEHRHHDFVAQRYQRLVDHSPNMTCVHESGRVVYLNPVGVKWMAAQSPEQIIGHPITEFVHPDSVPAMMSRIADLREVGDASQPSEAVLLRLDGTTLDVEAVSVLTIWEGKPAYQVIYRDLTTQKAAEETLRFQAALVNHVSDAIIATTSTGIITSWNPAAEAIYRRSASDALGMPIGEAVGAPLDPRAIITEGGVLRTTQYASDGMALAVRVSAAAMDNGYVLVCSDHTALLRVERRFQTVVASLEEGVIVLDGDGYVESVNPAALRILGVSDRSALDDPVRRAAMLPLYDAEGRPLDRDRGPVREFLRTGTPQTGFIVGIDRPSDGARIWLSANSRPLNPADPEDAALLISFTDVTADRQASQYLAHQAAHDTLTGLPNRASILARIDKQRRCGTPDQLLAAVLFIDLDNFKAINDSLGHDVGDVVLQTAAQRLRAGLRSRDVVGRFGGDEFVALILGKITHTELSKVADRMHAALSEPARVADAVLHLRASIGIVAIEGDDPRDVGQILRDADTAMYRAKLSGEGTSYYTDALRQRPS
ncbi:diguanylate cyclase [Mycobacterium haemophilum]|nr:diguanylate cyclase [Mycobacterium haemophilum]